MIEIKKRHGRNKGRPGVRSRSERRDSGVYSRTRRRAFKERTEGVYLDDMTSRDANNISLSLKMGALEVHKVEVTKVQGQKALVLQFVTAEGPNPELMSVTFSTVADQPFVTWTS